MDSHDSESCWIEPFRQTATGFEGTPAKLPELVYGVTFGEANYYRKDYGVDRPV